VTARPSLIAPEAFRRTPWKNGGGVSLTIAEQRAPGFAAGDWNGVVWQLGRTAITTPGPFSDLAGFERLQTVVAGRGLVLDTDTGDIDLRQPLAVARYDGGLRIVSRLEHGPVEVVNLMARRTAAVIELRVLKSGEAAQLPVGHHVLYAFSDPIEYALDTAPFALDSGHAATVDGKMTLSCRKGIVLAASVGAV
jgi:uncharacterized protein